MSGRRLEITSKSGKVLITVPSGWCGWKAGTLGSPLVIIWKISQYILETEYNGSLKALLLSFWLCLTKPSLSSCQMTVSSHKALPLNNLLKSLRQPRMNNEKKKRALSHVYKAGWSSLATSFLNFNTHGKLQERKKQIIGNWHMQISGPLASGINVHKGQFQFYPV